MGKWKLKYGKNHPTKAGQFRSSRAIKQDRKKNSQEPWEKARRKVTKGVAKPIARGSTTKKASKIGGGYAESLGRFF